MVMREYPECSTDSNPEAAAEEGATMGIERKKKSAQASNVCACGHAREAHEHYRRGTECSICDVRACSSFTPVAVVEFSKTR